MELVGSCRERWRHDSFFTWFSWPSFPSLFQALGSWGRARAKKSVFSLVLNHQSLEQASVFPKDDSGIVLTGYNEVVWQHKRLCTCSVSQISFGILLCSVLDAQQLWILILWQTCSSLSSMKHFDIRIALTESFYADKMNQIELKAKFYEKSVRG